VLRPDGHPGQQAAALDTLLHETLAALESGHSSNLVVHAFARTSRACGIGADLVLPFFDSMRMDLDRHEHDDSSFVAYVYGSAEVVGLMCLRAFVAAEPEPEARYELLAPGARRLGAAFQKVNFLRDLGADHDDLGRSYFPGIDPSRLTYAQRDALLDDIEADLAAGRGALPHLPRGSRVAVCAAHDLFAELAARLRQVPAREIRERRVRVPNPVKARLAAAAVLRSGLPRSGPARTESPRGRR
jgi:phytoene synthase